MSTVASLGESLQRDTSRLSLETIKEDMEKIENQAERTEASPKVAEANDGSEFMMITVGHCHNVIPAPKYHAELGMTSRSKMSQKEYEQCMMAKHVQANST